MGVNKVEYGSSTLVDLTGDTVTPETLLQGETAHNAAGNRITGTARPGVQSFNGRSGSVLPIAGDYSADQVNYDSNKTVKQVIDALVTKEASDITGQQSLLKDTVGWTGKNLLTPYYTGNKVRTYADGTITVTSNDDGTVGVVGTPSVNVGADIKRRVPNNNNTDLYIPVGRYIFSIDKDLAAKYNLIVEITRNSASYTVARSTTDSVEFEITSDMEADYKLSDGSVLISFTLKFTKNVVYNDVVHPMLRKADITDPTYEPYHESVEVMYEEEIHGVNLLKNTAVSKTENGITFTVNANGSVTVNGTASSTAYLYLLGTDAVITNIFGGCKLTGCPSGGSGATYGLVAQGFASTVTSNPTSTDQDNGSGTIVSSSTVSPYIRFYIRVQGGTTVNNLTFYPMIRKADIEDSTYRPYNEQAIQNQLNDKGVLGAKNWMPPLSAKTASGITWVINDDGSATMNGTATAGEANSVTVDATPYIGHAFILSGCISGGALNKYSVDIEELDNNNTQLAMYRDYGDGVTVPTIPSTVKKIRFRIYVASGQTFSNVVFYPMLRLASDPDDTYQPYAMTNRELTEIQVFDQNSSGFSAPKITIDWTKSVMKKCGNVCHFSFLITETQSIEQYKSIIQLPNEMKSNDAIRFMPSSTLPCAMAESGNIYATQAITAESGTKYLSGTYIV